MKVLLVWLMKDENVEFSNHRVDIQKVDAQIYIHEDAADEILERIVSGNHFGGYVIPDQYEGDIFIHDENHESLQQHPNHRNVELDYWAKIESHLPRYSSRQDVCDSNDFDKYIEGEDAELIEDIEANCPEYFTKKEWAIHQMAEVDTELFYEACTV